MALVVNIACTTYTTADEAEFKFAGLNDCVQSVPQKREEIFLSVIMGRRWFANPQRFGWYVLIRIARAVFTPIFYLAAVIVVKKAVIGKFNPGPRDMSQWSLLRHWLMAKLLPGGDLGKVMQLHSSAILKRMHSDSSTTFHSTCWQSVECGDRKEADCSKRPHGAQNYPVIADTTTVHVVDSGESPHLPRRLSVACSTNAENLLFCNNVRLTDRCTKMIACG